MHTVESIIRDVYGDAKTAAVMLGVKRPAVSNWKAHGHFPTRLVAAIFEHARQRGLVIEPKDIPVNERTIPRSRAA